METVSENTPKPKRGRPKSYIRRYADELNKMGLSPDGKSSRCKVDAAYTQSFFNLWHGSDAETQKGIMGHTTVEMANGTGCLPRGWATATAEIGRWIESRGGTDEAKASSIYITLNARKDGIAWRDIRAHFRKLRLGERKGNALSLTYHFCRALDEYMAKFPATTRQAQAGAARNLLESIEPNGG
jgi:hypothetical protein